MSNKKTLGQVFTPRYIVEKILDGVKYTDDRILSLKIMEPSFGEGAFLDVIIERLIKEGRKKGLPPETIAGILDVNIHGTELDRILFMYTRERLNRLLLFEGIPEIPWTNLRCKDYILHEFNVSFDVIVGNPPYIRTKNLSSDMKDSLNDYQFASGNTDSYILFFEKSIKLLSSSGQLGFITPNSYFKNNSQKGFRAYLAESNLIDGILDFKDSPIFPQTSTYTAITFINKDKSTDGFIYAEYDTKRCLYERLVSTKELGAAPWLLTNHEDKRFLDKMNLNSQSLGDYCNVQFGIATNGDTVFVGVPKEVEGIRGYVRFNDSVIEDGLLKAAYKSDEWDGKMMLFPYIWNKEREKHEIMDEQLLKTLYPLTYDYLSKNRDMLMGRNMDKGCKWYEFGRSQGLKSCGALKLTLSRFIDSSKSKLNTLILPADSLVYSGIYITAQEDDLDKIKGILESEDFIRYCRIAGKDMKGSWKTINAKIIKEYRIKNFREEKE